MVQQSGLAFRALARRYGCGLAYTQMFHAGHFADVAVYREENWDGMDSYGGDPASSFDRPLIAQFAGDEPGALVRAAAHVEHLVDAVDLNLGCPQVRRCDCVSVCA
jgi:tRNA-dihydrouridine synthase 1